MGLRIDWKSFGLGMFFVTLVGCGSLAFKYPYYELEEIKVWDGTLRGDVPEQNLPFATCSPTPANKNPCKVMLSEKFAELQIDYDKQHNDLVAAQQQLNECQAKLNK